MVECNLMNGNTYLIIKKTLKKTLHLWRLHPIEKKMTRFQPLGAPHVTPMAAMQLGSQEGDLLLNIMRQGLTMAGGGHGRAKMAWMLNGQLMAMNGYSRFIICK